MRDLEAGDELGRYRIERLLGSGGMGRVYAARDSVLRRRVALKLIHSLGPDDTAPAALLREARAAAAITHPNAVAIYDVGEHEGVPFIAMELLEGRPLRAFVGDATVNLERKVRWVVAIARALDAAHQAGLVHRDVKPGNVLVTPDDTIKVLDFGIAKRTRHHGDPTGEPETAVGAVKGTPRYMAPEQLMGATVDARTDQFAWGVLAYELFCGVDPWSTIPSEATLAVIVMTEDPRPPREVAPGVPAAVETIIVRALAKDPARRFRSMATIASELERAVDGGEEPEPTAETRAEPIVVRRRRGPASAIVFSIGAALAVTGCIFVWMHDRRGTPVASTSDARPAPTPVMALAHPSSSHPDAIAAYVAAMQAMHDAAPPLAHRELERALSLDPGLAAAALRLALMDETMQVPRARERYQQAAALRTNLSARDQALLEAIEPYLGRDPSDPNETAERLRALAERYPGDAEIQEELATAEVHRAEWKSVIAAASRALEIDPTYAEAFVRRGEAHAYTGDFDAAIADLDRCLAITPAAASCRAHRTEVRLRTVGCGGLEADAREWLSKDQSYFMGSALLAAVEMDRGDTRSAIDEAIHQALSREQGSWAATDEMWWTSSAAIVRGDFDSARKTGEKWLASIEGGQLNEHARPTRMLVQLLDEIGQRPAAARVAKDFLDRGRSWTVRTQGEDYAIADDLRPLAMAFAYPSTFAKDRDTWAEEWRKRVPPFFGPYIWASGFARSVTTHEDAVAALDALPRFGGAPPVYTPVSFADAYVGRTYRLANRSADALPHLKRAANQCALLWPIEQTRAIYDLGEALAAQGDVPGACTALRRVLARWGDAKPRSITAAAARNRWEALGCK